MSLPSLFFFLNMWNYVTFLVGHRRSGFAWGHIALCFLTASLLPRLWYLPGPCRNFYLWLGLSGSVIVRSLGGYGNTDWVMSIDITRHHPTVISGFGNGCQGHQTMTWPTGEWEPWNREVGLAWCPGSLRTLSVSALIELRKPIIPRQIWTSSHPQLVWRFSITSKSVTFILNVSKEQGTGTEETLNKHFLIKEWMD